MSINIPLQGSSIYYRRSVKMLKYVWVKGIRMSKKHFTEEDSGACLKAKKGPSRNRTGVAGIRIRSDDRYTNGPRE